MSTKTTTGELLSLDQISQEIRATELELRRAIANRTLKAIEIEPFKPADRPQRKTRYKVQPAEFQRMLAAGSLNQIHFKANQLNGTGWLTSSSDGWAGLINFVADWVADGGVTIEDWEAAFVRKFETGRFSSMSNIREITIEYGGRLPQAIRDHVQTPAFRGFARTLSNDEEKKRETIADSVMKNRGLRAMRMTIEQRFGRGSLEPVELLYLSPEVFGSLIAEARDRLAAEPFISRPVEVSMEIEGNHYHVQGRVSFNLRALQPGAAFVTKFDGLF